MRHQDPIILFIASGVTGGIMSEFSKASVSNSEVEETKPIDARIPKPRWLSRKVVADISLLYDMAAIIFSAWASYYLYLINYLNDAGVDSKGYFLIVMIVAALFYVIARQRGQYDQHMDFRFTSQVSTLIYVCAITISREFGFFCGWDSSLWLYRLAALSSANTSRCYSATVF
jgi:hypothetical protein